MQANAAGLGTLKELSSYNFMELQIIMKYKEVYQEWSEENNGRG